MKKDFFAPVLALTLICVLMTGALAYTNGATQPAIEAGAQARAAQARMELLPAAEDFIALPLDAMPASITEAYASTNGVGYLFTAAVTGYGGTMKLLCAVSADGAILATKVLEHSETKGLGTKVMEEPYYSQYIGRTLPLDGISAISGATISSNAYRSAAEAALAALETVEVTDK